MSLVDKFKDFWNNSKGKFARGLAKGLVGVTAATTFVLGGMNKADASTIQQEYNYPTQNQTETLPIRYERTKIFWPYNWTIWADPEYMHPWGMACDGDYLFVNDPGIDTPGLYKLNRDGELVAYNRQPLFDPPYWSQLETTLTASEDYLFTTDGSNIYRYTKNGTFVDSFSTEISGIGSIVYDRFSYYPLIYALSGNSISALYNGNVVHQFSTPVSISQIGFDGQNIFGASLDSNTIYKFGWFGNLLDSYELDVLHGGIRYLSFADDGKLYVMDRGSPGEYGWDWTPVIYEFTPVPVSETSTLALLAAAGSTLGGLALLRRRKANEFS